MAKIQLWNITRDSHSTYEYERGKVTTMEALTEYVEATGEIVGATDSDSHLYISQSLFPKGDETEFPEFIFALLCPDNESPEYFGLTILES